MIATRSSRRNPSVTWALIGCVGDSWAPAAGGASATFPPPLSGVAEAVAAGEVVAAGDCDGVGVAPGDAVTATVPTMSGWNEQA